MRKHCCVLPAAVGLLVCAGTADAQMAHRLKGSLKSTSGAAIANGAVRADNLSGFPKQPRATPAAIDDIRGIARIQ